MAVARRYPEVRIVYIAVDVARLVSRVQLLKSAGYAVIATTSRHVAVLAAGDHGIDGVIVCDSLSPGEDESLAYGLAIVAPRTAVLRVRELTDDGLAVEAYLVSKVNELFRGRSGR